MDEYDDIKPNTKTFILETKNYASLKKCGDADFRKIIAAIYEYVLFGTEEPPEFETERAEVLYETMMWYAKENRKAYINVQLKQRKAEAAAKKKEAKKAQAAAKEGEVENEET